MTEQEIFRRIQGYNSEAGACETATFLKTLVDRIEALESEMKTKERKQIVIGGSRLPKPGFGPKGHKRY
jgi:hypothetical protein